MSAKSHAETDRSLAPLAFALPSRSSKILAMCVCIASVIVVAVLAPVAQKPLAAQPAFIAAYHSALIVCDAITAVLLYGQYRVSRVASLFILACGYLFTGLIAAVHLLTFPGLFAETGLLGAGTQTTAWLYMAWHAVFPLFVIVYATWRPAPLTPRAEMLAFVGLSLIVGAIAIVATAGQSLLPSIMRGHGYGGGYHAVVVLVWLCSVAAMGAVWRKRPRTLLDLWLLVVLVSWVCDIALAAVLNAGRFDVGFYAGRIYGLLAAAFVLSVLLIEISGLHRRVAAMTVQADAHRKQRAADRDANFLLSLSEELRPLEDPVDIQYRAARALGEHLRANRVGFAEDQGDGETVRVACQHTRGVSGMEGLYRYTDYGSTLRFELESGRTVLRSDVCADPALSAQEKAAHSALRLTAAANVPLVKNGRLHAVLFVHYDTPHEWSADEVALLQNVAERTWGALERARAEAAQRAAVERYERQVRLFEGVASNTPDFVYVFDTHGRFLYANQRLLAVWGMTLDETVGKTCLELGYEAWHHDMHMREIAQVIATKLPIKGEVPFKAPLTGVSGVYEYIFAPVIGPNGEVELIAGTTRDVTERKEVERRKDDFIATLSHELRNPLAPMRNALDLMKLGAASESIQKTAREIMERQVTHLVRLVDDLLELSRITRGAFDLRKAPVPVAVFVEAAVETSRPAITAAGHELRVLLPDERLVVLGDGVRLAQVFSNLLNNAAAYTSPGGKITLEARREGLEAVICVSDTGEGIDPDELPRLFLMFSRGQRTSRAHQSGLGIGLALVKSLVDMHGGSTGAESAGRGKGSRFTVRLPLAALPDPSTQSHGEVVAKAMPARVLVVDDNRDAAMSLAMLLRCLGTEAEVTFDGPSALDKFDEHRPEVVLLDIGMPDMDGYEVARRIRQRPYGARVPIVAVTGWGQDEDRRLGREAGFDHHLVKPVEIGALQALLASLAQGRVI